MKQRSVRRVRNMAIIVALAATSASFPASAWHGITLTHASGTVRLSDGGRAELVATKDQYRSSGFIWVYTSTGELACRGWLAGSYESDGATWATFAGEMAEDGYSTCPALDVRVTWSAVGVPTASATYKGPWLTPCGRPYPYLPAAEVNYLASRSAILSGTVGDRTVTETKSGSLSTGNRRVKVSTC